MSHIDDIADVITIHKDVTAANPWPELSHFEKGTPYEGRMPKVDIIEYDDEFYMCVELPGVNKKSIDISMTDNSVTIKGSSKRDKKEVHGYYYRREIPGVIFVRTLKLPTQINLEKTIATIKDGVLKLTMPKKLCTKHQSIEST